MLILTRSRHHDGIGSVNALFFGGVKDKRRRKQYGVEIAFRPLADLISVMWESGESPLHKADLTVSANPRGSSRAKVDL